MRPTGEEHDETLVVGNDIAAIARAALMWVMLRQLRALAAQAAPVVVALLVVPAAAWADERPTTKSVLLLHAEARLAPGIATTDREIRSALQQSIGPIRFYTESLDASWFPDARVGSAVADVLLEKYGGRRLDLVVPVGPAALRFALSQRERIFPRVPIVFAGGLRPTVADAGAPPGVTGTWLDFDWAANLDLIARLHPDTRRIAFVYGSSAFDRSQSKDFHEAFAAYRDRLELLELTDLSFDVLLQRVAALPAGTVIVFFSFLRDRDGEAFIPVDTLRAISRVAPVPIYAVSDTLAAAPPRSRRRSSRTGSPGTASPPSPRTSTCSTPARSGAGASGSVSSRVAVSSCTAACRPGSATGGTCSAARPSPSSRPSSSWSC
jgi:hypothetical protein